MKNFNKLSVFFASILIIAGLTAPSLAGANCASWGWDRVTQRQLPVDNYCNHADASGRHLYVLDTGINDISEFVSDDGVTSRIADGWSGYMGGTTDPNGHGTCLTSVATGETYGFADDAIIHPVRVLNHFGSGSMTNIIAGLDWVHNNAEPQSVVLLAFGGGYNAVLNSYVEMLIDGGLVVVIAAGNDNRDACNYSPANVPGAITVGAIDPGDQKSSFTNYGSCVDICAPGRDIYCAMGTPTEDITAELSGTNMAAAHVAGAALAALRAGHCSSSDSCANYLTSQSSVTIPTPGGGCPLLYVGNLN